MLEVSDPPSSGDELVDIVNERDRVVGRASRRDAYARRLPHRCVFVLVRDHLGRVFVHQRTASKLIFPSHCDMFVGGVVHAGESYDDAAVREAREELGVAELGQLTRLFTFLYDDAEHTWWCAVYEGRCDVPVRPQADEIAWHSFLTDDELDRRFSEWTWTPDSAEAYRRLRSR
ncbi:NUDIX domain-containing protein [Actinobacteria bacterium YIM 96077]|uniref:NUDIX hydrolase n=1 Tax=Phytoactinopolyspora halophila TaxID=1981511 RepID=A0A329QPA2_9ACTN|nr:NUDIX domain-containing protein [Phytoactinopolyspora halophila]AYY15039.1 NUDIX domain-containing protein [Actinobacteria bacterium YIM 96077]RAW14195.1 NUDIX hydrolase [Phytoactinopolyspora halophila]